MPSTTYNVNFLIVTSGDVQFEVSASSEQEAIDIATDALLPQLQQNQHLQFQDVVPVYLPSTNSNSNSDYTSLSSFYQAPPTNQEAALQEESASAVPTPGYSRLIN